MNTPTSSELGAPPARARRPPEPLGRADGIGIHSVGYKSSLSDAKLNGAAITSKWGRERKKNKKRGGGLMPKSTNLNSDRKIFRAADGQSADRCFVTSLTDRIDFPRVCGRARPAPPAHADAATGRSAPRMHCDDDLHVTRGVKSENFYD
ncbi:hypothetical protein EVAR_62738_1 [Eumeta japonica]|uniref:Uncharacterized protein n=1 Tax=Eumeta variegata TaxID=151549 RepID=A0A4C1Z6J1_EUMVA|nr:hypothetical protein EVAR_62738_1 [Eumeta japonica]